MPAFFKAASATLCPVSLALPCFAMPATPTVISGSETAMMPTKPSSLLTNPSCVITPVKEVFPIRGTPGSVSFVPSVAGLILAGEVVRILTKAE